MSIAFIDFDGTAIKGDSVVSFIRYLYKEKKITLKEYLHSIKGGILYKLGYYNEHKSKEVALKFIERFSKSDIDQLAKNFVNTVLKEAVFNEMHTLIAKHRQNGDKIVIVSASPNIYMQFIADIIDCDKVLCTELIADNNAYLSKIYGLNCKGDEKILRIRKLIRSEFIDCDLTQCHAYGDSKSDLPMINLVGHKHIVNNYKLYNKYVHTKQYDLLYWLI